jgi:hypothetical protein
MAPTAHSLAGLGHVRCGRGNRKRHSLSGLVASGSRRGERQENDEGGLLHGTRFIAPVPAATPGRGRNWHLSTSEGCQRVTEPNLSPLLYKTEKTAPPAAGEYLCWRRQRYTQFAPVQLGQPKCLAGRQNKQKRGLPPIKRPPQIWSGFSHLFSAKST